MLRLFAVSLTLNALGILLALGLNVFLARTIGPEELGIYAEAVAWSILLATIATAGADRLAVREVNSQSKHGTSDHLYSLLTFLRRRVLLWSITIGGCAAGLWCAIGLSGLSSNWLPLAFACAATPVGSNLILNLSLLHASQHNRVAQLPDQVIRPIVVLLIAFPLFLLGLLSGTVAVITYVLSTCVALFVSAHFLKRALLVRDQPTAVPIEISVENYQDWSRAALVLTVVVFVHVLSTRLDVILLGALSDSVEVGLYHVASRVAVLSTTLLSLFNLFIGPQAAQLLAEKDRIGLQRKVTYGVRTISLVMVPWFVAIVGYPEVILLIFGPEYTSAHGILRILAIANIFNIITGPAGTLLNAVRLERDLLFSVTVGLVVLLLLSFALIPTMGSVGAAYASGVALVTLNLVATVLLRIRTGIDSTIVGWGLKNESSNDDEAVISR